MILTHRKVIQIRRKVILILTIGEVVMIHKAVYGPRGGPAPVECLPTEQGVWKCVDGYERKESGVGIRERPRPWGSSVQQTTELNCNGSSGSVTPGARGGATGLN